MKQALSLKSISELHRLLGIGPVRHPLLTVLDFSEIKEYGNESLQLLPEFYSIMCKSNCHNHLRYGRKPVDFQEGSLVCMAPFQLVGLESENLQLEKTEGWGLFFHPDLIRGTKLGTEILDYNFFSYETSEALHLSEKERLLLWDCISKIQAELNANLDSFSNSLMVSLVGLLLTYCNRFYGRQFITRSIEHRDLVARFENCLRTLFHPSCEPQSSLITVKDLAENLHVSPGYLSDILKRETGLSAQEHIHYFLIEKAKNGLLGSSRSVSEIAFSLGFEYPQYFSRLFRQKTGLSPQEFRRMK